MEHSRPVDSSLGEKKADKADKKALEKATGSCGKGERERRAPEDQKRILSVRKMKQILLFLSFIFQNYPLL